MPYRYAGCAEDQIDRILLESAEDWGIEAATRYHRLILTALGAVGDFPTLPGSNPVPRVPGVRSLHLRLARRIVAPEHRVKDPRHLVIYRIAPDGIVEVLGLAHDRMRLTAAARRARREADR